MILHLTIRGPVRKNPPPVTGWGIFVGNGPIDYFPSFNVLESNSKYEEGFIKASAPREGDVVDKLYFLIHSVLSSLLPLMLICRAGIDQFAAVIL